MCNSMRRSSLDVVSGHHLLLKLGHHLSFSLDVHTPAQEDVFGQLKIFAFFTSRIASQLLVGVGSGLASVSFRHVSSKLTSFIKLFGTEGATKLFVNFNILGFNRLLFGYGFLSLFIRDWLKKPFGWATDFGFLDLRFFFGWAADFGFLDNFHFFFGSDDVGFLDIRFLVRKLLEGTSCLYNLEDRLLNLLSYFIRGLRNRRFVNLVYDLL